MDPNRAAAAETPAAQPPIRRADADPRPRRADGDPVRAPQRDPLEHAAARDGLRIRARPVGAVSLRWQRAGVWKRLHAVLLAELRRRGQLDLARAVVDSCVPPRAARGKKTGPNPTDRRKAGSKHHVLTDAHGIPLVATLTAANRHDVTQLLPLVDAMPPLRGRPGRPVAQAATRPRRSRVRFAAASRPALASAASPPSSPSAGARTAAGWAAPAGSSNAPSPGCIAFVDWRCATNVDPAFTRRFSR